MLHGIVPTCLLEKNELSVWKGVTMTRLLRLSKFWLLDRVLLVVITLTIAGVSQAQTTRTPAAAGGDEPVFLDYRGIKIGWVADEVRKKLGNPAEDRKSVV